ncbi:hypothetical protein A8C75_22495 [Marinobacterium aestuarii]|uniref:Uncharacterized protein n=1 Tax=Marinobacterium aestuarii TaxID=1821621 RepID=A0A1A9F468_9GAMM|nr:hypothetical protein [Marinobacterium aestuarii]ANG64975.1 hypothetical protein A8C75_22495 [Marinobacterium aestuarii]
MLRLGLLLLLVPAIGMMVGYMMEQSLIDACLDAGGSFDYAAEACDPVGNHAFVPFSARKPLLVNGGMLLSTLGLFLCLGGLYTRRS